MTLTSSQNAFQWPQNECPYTYAPVTHEGRPAYEVICSNGRGTGIIRFTPRSANGAAQTLNNNARSLIKRRARLGGRTA